MGCNDDCWFCAVWADGSSWSWGSSVQMKGWLVRLQMMRAGGGFVLMQGGGIYEGR